MNILSANPVYSQMFISRALPMLGLAMALGFSLPAHAQNNNFTNAANASWSLASAWSLGVPTSSQDVYHTNTSTTINVNINASAKTLTIGGASGTALFNMNNAGVSLTTGGDITLAPGGGNGTLQLNATNLTLSINGGAGSIINGGGVGTATLNISSGVSNSLGLLNASVDDLNLGQGSTVTLIITNGQTYNVASLLRLNNSTTVAGVTGTILMNGGTLNSFGQEIRFNTGTNTANQSYLILNSNAVVTAATIQRQNLGADAAIHWNDGTIGNYAGTNLVITANGTTNGIMNVKLAGTGTHTFDASSTNTITVAATAQLQDKSGEAGTLVKAGTGVLILSGSNSYTGGTTLNAGTIRVNDDSGLGSGGLTLNAGTLASTNARALANNVTVGGSVALGESATGTGALTFNGTVNLGSGNTVTINRASTFANAVSGTGTFSVATNGSVVVTGSGSMTTGTAISLTTSGTSFDISGVSGSGVTVGSVASAASSTVALGAKALTLGGDNTSTTLAGTVTGATGGSLVKNGSGTLTLVVSNSHTGGVTLNAGALALSNNFALGTGALTINGGSVGSAGGARNLANNLVLNTNLTVNAGGTFSVSGNVDLAGGTRVINQISNNSTYSGVISNGGLTISNGGSGIDTILSGANTYSGATTVRQGLLQISGSGSLSNSAVNLTGGSASTLSIASVTSSTEIGSLAGNANSKVDLGAKTLIVGRDNTGTTFAGVMSNTGSLVKTGSGIMTLSGTNTNTYTGSTTVSGGSLIVVRTNLTATITPTSISVAFSNTPATSTPYPILTGPLAGGPYSTVTVSSPSGYNGTVDTNSGTVSVTAASSANPPTITSTNAFTGTVGVAFSNNITATGDTPITFSGTGLPGGLSVASNGAITGTPTNAVTVNATLTATNAAGTNTRSVTFTIAKGTPSIITLPTASDLTAGQALVSSSLTGGNGSVVGAFAWTDSSIIPQVGTSSRSVTFTPTDTANYNTATTSVSVTVKPAGESIGNFLPAGQPTNSETVGKYLIGGATNFNASSESPVVTASSTHLVLTAIIRTNDAGYSSNQVVGQWVTNLSDYSGLAAGSNEVIGAPSANQTNVPTGFQRRDFSVNRDNGTNRLFLRLKATLQP